MVVHGLAVPTEPAFTNSLINLSTVLCHTENVPTLLRQFHQQLKLWLDGSFLIHTNVPEDTHCAPEEMGKQL